MFSEIPVLPYPEHKAGNTRLCVNIVALVKASGWNPEPVEAEAAEI